MFTVSHSVLKCALGCVLSCSCVSSLLFLCQFSLVLVPVLSCSCASSLLFLCQFSLVLVSVSLLFLCQFSLVLCVSSLLLLVSVLSCSYFGYFFLICSSFLCLPELLFLFHISFTSVSVIYCSSFISLLSITAASCPNVDLLFFRSASQLLLVINLHFLVLLSVLSSLNASSQDVTVGY